MAGLVEAYTKWPSARIMPENEPTTGGAQAGRLGPVIIEPYGGGSKKNGGEKCRAVLFVGVAMARTV